MKTNRFIPALMALLMLATAIPSLTACSDDDDNNGNGTEQTAMYDDLAVFQQAICTIDSSGQHLIRYNIGEALYESEPQHLYIGVDDIDEAAKWFRCWIAPDVELPAQNGDLTAQLTDTLGKAQGTIYFRVGSGTTVAEVTASPETQLKFVDKITFLLNSAWPYNSETKVWHLGDIRAFTLTGTAVAHLKDNDKTLNFVLIREAGNGVKPMWAAITNNKYKNQIKKNKYSYADFYYIKNSDFCPDWGSAYTISNLLRENWDYFADRFSEAGCGPLDASKSYWINSTNGTFWIHYECMMYSNGQITGITALDGEEYFLLKVDGLEDGQYPLIPTWSNAEGSNNPGEGYENLFDERADTKWLPLCAKQLSDVSDKYCWCVEFESYSPISPKSYLLMPGGDTGTYPERNPKSWALYGKKNTRSQWTLMDSRTDNHDLPPTGWTGHEFTISNQGEYQYFRFEIYEAQNDGHPQLSIFSFRY